MKIIPICAVVLALNLRLTSQGAEKAAPPDGYRDTPMLPDTKWHVHDPDRPQPAVVTPGTCSTPEKVGAAPSDAVVLFNGTDQAHWRDRKGQPAAWAIEEGALKVSKGDISTAESFGDIQLHIEFATPVPAAGKGQGRGNSGIFLMGLFEFQVLDSFQSTTYPDGQAGALYGQHPPLVNASRPPGEWQQYDIAFTAPRVGSDGKVERPAYVTAFHNGVLVQNHQPYLGPTGHRISPHYPDHLPATGPIKLQEHSNAVRYRNIWVRPLATE